MAWLTLHWQQLAEIASALFLLLGLINALLPEGKFKSGLGALLNFLAPLTRKDAPGTLKLPFTRGKAGAK